MSSMNVNVLSSNYALAGVASAGAAPAMQGADPDGDGDGAGAAGVSAGGRHHRGGGGQIGQALSEALQGLGVTPQMMGAQGGGAAKGNDGDADDGGASSTSGTSVQQDVRNFMHQLFEALKSQSGTSAAAGASSKSQAADSSAASKGQRPNFSADLSSLISQVSSGNVPSGLAGAFNKLASDLQASNTANASQNAGTPTGAAMSLQQFLAAIQQSIGYKSNGADTTGNLLSTAA